MAVLGAGVTGDCELWNVGTRTHTGIFCKSSTPNCWSMAPAPEFKCLTIWVSLSFKRSAYSYPRCSVSYTTCTVKERHQGRLLHLFENENGKRDPWVPQSRSCYWQVTLRMSLTWLTWQSNTGPLVFPSHGTVPEIWSGVAGSQLGHTLYFLQRWTLVVTIDEEESADRFYSSSSWNIPGSLLVWVLKLQTPQGNWRLLLNTAKACISLSHLFRISSPAWAIFSDGLVTWELKGVTDILIRPTTADSFSEMRVQASCLVGGQFANVVTLAEFC